MCVRCVLLHSQVTDEFDKTKYVRALRVGLLVWIKGTRNKIKPSRVALWQREKAEWILQSYHTNEILGTWKKFHYLCFASKIELAGPWDVIKDQPYESRLIVEGLSQKQFQSTEENQAIWSHRFMKRYGNPTLLVLDPRQRDQLLMTLNKRISEAEVKMTKTFAVRKRLNAYQVCVLSLLGFFFRCMVVCISNVIDSVAKVSVAQVIRI